MKLAKFLLWHYRLEWYSAIQKMWTLEVYCVNLLTLLIILLILIKDPSPRVTLVARDNSS